MRFVATVLAVVSAVACSAQRDVIHLRMLGGIGAWGIPPKEATDPVSRANRAVFEAFHDAHPGIRIDSIGGIQIKGPASESNFLLSMAGDTAPDVFYVNFRQLWNFYDQGFMYPLDEYIRADPQVFDDVHPQIREVVTLDGHVYCVPWFQVSMALYYRKDLFAAAGLDPSRPPRDWDELVEYGRKLTRDKPRQAGFAFDNQPQAKGWFWTNFLWQAGGDVLKRDAEGNFVAAFNTPEGALALDMFKRLTTETWIGPNGKGMGPIAPTRLPMWEEVSAGRVAMWFSYSSDVMVNTSELNPELIGIAPLPKGPAGWANEINAGSWAINASIRDKRKRDAAWQFIKFMASEEAARVRTEAFVNAGLAKFINPVHLQKFGYGRYVKEVDPAWVEANREAFKHGHPEVNGKNTQLVYLQLDEPLERAIQNPKADSLKLLNEAAAVMNKRMLDYVPPEVRQARRRWAWSILAAIAVLGSILGGRALVRRRGAVEDFEVSRAAGSQRGFAWITVWLLMLPAIASVAVWAYYPLVRGLMMAFQDYKILLPTVWVGIDNFIDVFFSETFWRGLINSSLYTALSLAIGFFAPIILAIGLNEVPRGKMLFRTLYYLPAVTSGIVIMLVWREFYDKSDTGLMNILALPIFTMLNWCVDGINAVAHTGIQHLSLTHDWLGDPSWALLAVVLPAVWAGAGPGSIIYLAAMKSIPEEIYEAADLDGASVWHKIRHVTIPGLKPLIIINLVGVFIASFKAMENIFVMTGGGPLHATHVLGLEIWYKAFVYLQFGYATAAAWVMGALLIGFTMLQIRNLLKMRFSAAR
jgi:ABC-type sugar transport system permease subunit/ABC-type glycerol-3-phosphate transport system substrate-binding protein